MAATTMENAENSPLDIAEREANVSLIEVGIY